MHVLSGGNSPRGTLVSPSRNFCVMVVEASCACGLLDKVCVESEWIGGERGGCSCELKKAESRVCLYI